MQSMEICCEGGKILAAKVRLIQNSASNTRQPKAFGSLRVLMIPCPQYVAFRGYTVSGHGVSV